MPRGQKFPAEQIIGKLREAEVELARGKTMPGNSNPRSLDQHLINVLSRAQRHGVFVPWPYVMADATVSGPLACRRGYTLPRASSNIAQPSA